MDHIVWSINPVLLHIGPLAIHWYGVLFAGGIFVGMALLKYIYKLENKDPQEVDNLLVYIVVGIIVGARLAHTLIYEPDYYLSNPIEILYIWRGGLASHGGLLGMMIAVWIYCKRYNESFTWIISRLTIPGAIFASMVRVGNFFNSEILGKTTNSITGIIFSRVDNLPRHPVQLYEAVAYAIFVPFLWYLYKRFSTQQSTAMLPGIFLIYVFSIRFILEFFKVQQASYTLSTPLTVGQLLSIPFILIGIIWIWYGFKIKKEKI